MAGTRQPLDLLLAKGNKHFSQAEIEQRRAQEVKAPAPKTLRVPKYLPKGLHKKFRAIGKQLAALNLLSELERVAAVYRISNHINADTRNAFTAKRQYP